MADNHVLLVRKELESAIVDEANKANMKIVDFTTAILSFYMIQDDEAKQVIKESGLALYYFLKGGLPLDKAIESVEEMSQTWVEENG